MSSRDDILSAVRSAKPGLDAPAPTVPNYDENYPQERAGLVDLFAERLTTMGGTWHALGEDQSIEEAVEQALSEKLGKPFADAVIASNVPEIPGNRTLTEIARALSVEHGKEIRLEQVVAFFEAHAELGYCDFTHSKSET